MKEKLFGIISWLWQLPQNFIAVMIEAVVYPSSMVITAKYKDERVISSGLFKSTFSLGKFIFTNNSMDKEGYVKALGYMKLSEKLGWLYLVVITLPLLCGKLVKSVAKIFGKEISLDNFYTEKLANIESEDISL